MEGLNWQTIQLALAAGMNQKADSRALQPPEFTSLLDAQFDEIGGLQTRKPWATATGPLAIVGGGTIDPDDQRALVENDAELLLFTKTAVYSRNAALDAWALKGTHLAVKVTETPRFVSTGEQTQCDRVELDGTIVTVWVDGTTAYAAATDKDTGAVVVAPTAVGGSVNDGTRPRVVALATKILLFVNFPSGSVSTGGVGGVYVRAIDPADVATGLASSLTFVCGNDAAKYDAVKVPSADKAALVVTRNPTTSYDVATVTAGLTVTSVTKARACTGAIALSADPTGTYLQVVRFDTNSVLGDLLNASTLADVYTGQSIAPGVSSPNQIACAHRSVQDSGAYRCYVFFDYSFGSAAIIQSSWVDTGNTAGSVVDFLVGDVGVASRAFDHDGSVYFHVAFYGVSFYVDAALQNTYYLYRDDGFLAGKALAGRAGGAPSTTGHLPGVASTDTGIYSWCGTERRRIPLGNFYGGYADRGPNELTVEFDSNEARRCVRLGRTLYITGSEIKQYDGTRLVELGFHYYPYTFAAGDSGSGTGLANGSYSYKFTFRWQNAQGETERSTTGSIATIDVAGGPHDVSIEEISTLTITHKTDNPPAIEAWRTKVNPPETDAPYFLISDPDPTNTSATNGYLENDETTATLYHSSFYGDAIGDDDLGDNESNPENGTVLENLAPPAATLIAASDTRLFLAGIAGAPDQVWYSKQRNEGEVAAFNDALVVTVPSPGGAITAIVVAADGTPVVFRETATYVLLGDGVDNGGGGQNYVARLASPDVGAVSQESVALSDAGVYFKSSKGWRILNRAFQVANIGDPVTDYDSEDPLAVVVMKAQNQIRVLTSSRMLVLDTLASEAMGRPTWAEWSVDDGVHACLWNGVHVYLSSSAGLMQQRSDYTGVDYGMDVETAWIKLNDLQGFGRLRRLLVLGEYRSSHSLRVRLARDYQTTYFQDKTWTVSPTEVGGPLQVKHGPSIQQMQAIKVRLTATMDVAGEYATSFSSTVPSLATFFIFVTAKETGTSFNGNTLELVADGTGTGTFEDGAAAVFHYESGVTTVEDLIVASALSDYIVVTGTGTINSTNVYTLSGGADSTQGTPNGEALKLTGLGLEVGIKRGLRPNLPSTQRQ